jgi:hypothetical protein
MSAGTPVAAGGTARRTESQEVIVEIGGVPIALRSDDADFRAMIDQRYAGFLNPAAEPAYEFDIYLDPPPTITLDEDAHVFRDGSLWRFERGDFRAEWDVEARRGYVRQSANPYAIDAVLRIAHSLVLAGEGGFLVHAASAVRNGRAFLFAGVSGAGKTTLSQLASPDATVLTDEISYVRRSGQGYRAYGTPFAGELARVGTNVSAPVDTLFFLVQGPVNRIEPVGQLAAGRELLRHTLFFAHDSELVKQVFYAALEFVSRVNVARLVFTPEARAWELVG